MAVAKDRRLAREKRRRRVRKRLLGTPERPRLAVFRSLRHISAQVIDDIAGRTLLSAATTEAAIREKLSATATCQAAATLGTILAQRALEKGITRVVFDRSGYLYHGRFKALAEAAREAGLDF
jgi:large subunit ribosomal protein L18